MTFYPTGDGSNRHPCRYTYNTTLTLILILRDSASGEFQLNFASEDCKSHSKRVDILYLSTSEAELDDLDPGADNIRRGNNGTWS